MQLEGRSLEKKRFYSQLKNRIKKEKISSNLELIFHNNCSRVNAERTLIGTFADFGLKSPIVTPTTRSVAPIILDVVSSLGVVHLKVRVPT
jgi:hypothetical protein